MSLETFFESNVLCRMLGIKYPICQAGMYQVAYGKLTAAVSEAGGLGVIGAAYMTGEELREEIHIARNETDNPFGVDILFARVAGADAAAAGYSKQVQEHVDVVFDEDVPVLVSGLGNPGDVIKDAHAKGMKVMSLVGTSRQAKAVQASGVDVVIASGHHGGGHVGRIGTMSLIPRVVDSV